MSRVVLKERQFEPTGKNLGDFRPSDLESFDLQYIDSDIDDKIGQESGGGGGSNKSHVPDPLDDDRLNNSKSNKSSGNSSSGGNQSKQDSNDDKNSSDEPEGIQDIPDTWDPYGNDLDDEDPDMPEEIKNNGSEDDGGGGGYASPEDSDVPNQVPQPGQQSSGNSDAKSDGDSGEDNQGQGSGTGNSSGDLSNDGNSDSSSGGSDLESLLNDYQDEDSGDSQDSGNPNGNSNQNSDGNHNSDGNGSSNSSLGDNNNKPSGTSSNSSSRGGQRGEDSDSSGTVPSVEELEAEDDDFDSSGSLSDLEQALDDIDSRSSSASKQKNKSDMERAEQEDEMSDSPRDMEDEIAAAKDLAGKAARDMRSDKDSSLDDPSISDEYGESEEDILQDIGLGNLTSVFNPGNLQDWRTRLDKIFDKALGFDIVTNPNLVNKKIEDAPPGREDDTPQIDHIAILLDMSSSMGAGKFKEVIGHIDTMIRARKLNRVWFHIIGFGSRHIRDLERYYDKVKGMKLKQTLMTKYKNDANWMTDFLPGMQLCIKKVPRPDGIIVLTDADFNGKYREFLNDTKVSAFMKKNRKRIIWALTSNAKLSNVTAYDSSAVSNKRYIKFKKDGSKD